MSQPIDTPIPAPALFAKGDPTRRGVLHIATERGWRGGERQAFLLIRGLRERGVEQALLTPKNSPLAKHCRSDNLCQVFRIPTTSRYQPANWLALRRAVRKFRPALIHAHTAHGHAMAWLATPRNIPIVATRRVDFPPKRGLSRGRRYTSPRVNNVAISREIERLLHDFGCPHERVFHVPSGIDPRRFDDVRVDPGRAEARRRFRDELEIEDDTILIGATSALVDHKGLTYLVKALQLLKGRLKRPVLCIIAGEGELHSVLEREIQKLGLDMPAASVCARLLGFRRDIPELLSALDIFALSSHLEGLGTSVVDAMCMGLPIVATRVGGVPDLIHHEKTGLLVPARNPEELADALERVASDPQFADRLGARAALDFSQGPFHADAMVLGNLNVYQAILKR